MEKAIARSPAPPDGGRGHRLQAGLRRRRVAGRGDAEDVASTRWSSPAASRSAATCRFPGRELEGIHFAMDYLPLQNKRCEGDAVADEPVHHGEGQARRDHRRRRHRRRLPRHGAPPGRRSRCTSSSCCRAAGDPRAPTTRGRSGRTSSASRRRTKRAASGSTRSRRRSSSATTRAASARWPASSVQARQGRRPAGVQAGARHRVRAAGRPRAAGDGLHRRREQGPGRATSAWR